MARVDDRWVLKDGTRTALYGKGSRWQAVWTEAGRERKKAFRTKDAAKAHLTHVDHTQRSGTYVSKDLGRVYIGDLLDQWLDSCVHLAPSTMATTRSDVRATIRPYWGEKVLADVTKADVQAWVTSMAKAARTVDTIYGRFRNFLNWCISEGRLQVNPATGVKLPKGRKREHIYLNVEQVRALAEAIGDHGDLVWFLATTGLRFGEAAELRGRDIDLRRRRVIVSRSVTEADGRMVVGPPKNGEPRDVPLTAFMVERIRDRVKGLGRDALLFPTQRGKWMRSNNFKTRTYDPAVLAAGLPPELWVHDLRHTAASLAVHSGASVKSVQRMLGHASAALTLDIYAGLFDQELSDVAARMDNLLAPKLVPALPNSSQTA
jgi:integrase